MGGLALALIAAGVWLNHSAAPTGAPTAAPREAPREARNATAATDPHHLLPPPRPAPSTAPTATARGTPGPEQAPPLAPAARGPDGTEQNTPPPDEAGPDRAALDGTGADDPGGGVVSRVGPGEAPLPPTDGATAPEPPPDTGLPRADRLTAYRGGPVWQLARPEDSGETYGRMILAALGSRHGAAPYFGAAAVAAGSDSIGIVTGYAALEPAEAAALRACRGDCTIVARLVPEDFDGRRADTLNAAQAEARAQLTRAARMQGPQAAFHHVLAWSDEGAFGTGSLGDPEAARILAMLACRTEQRRITGPEDGAASCRAALVAGPPPTAGP